MKPSRILTYLASGLCLLCLAGPAHAAFIYQYAAELSDATLELGETTQLDVYLQETVTGGDTSRLLGSGNGLISAGTRAHFGAGASARVLSTNDIQPNIAGFDSLLFLVKDLPGDGTAGFLEAVDLLAPSPPVQGVSVAPDVARVFLGRFIFSAVSPGVTAVTIGDYNPNTVDIVTAGGIFIDDPSSNVAPATVTLTVVPEPSSLVLIGLGMAGVMVLSRRRGTGDHSVIPT